MEKNEALMRQSLAREVEIGKRDGTIEKLEKEKKDIQEEVRMGERPINTRDNLGPNNAKHAALAPPDPHPSSSRQRATALTSSGGPPCLDSRSRSLSRLKRTGLPQYNHKAGVRIYRGFRFSIPKTILPLFFGGFLYLERRRLWPRS
jgi:hypothetical protein